MKQLFNVSRRFLLLRRDMIILWKDIASDYLSANHKDILSMARYTNLENFIEAYCINPTYFTQPFLSALWISTYHNPDNLPDYDEKIRYLMEECYGKIEWLKSGAIGIIKPHDKIKELAEKYQ